MFLENFQFFLQDKLFSIGISGPDKDKHDKLWFTESLVLKNFQFSWQDKLFIFGINAPDRVEQIHIDDLS